MVGKSFRKKQVVSQYERQEEGVAIDLCQLLGLSATATEQEQHALLDSLPIDFKTFLLNLTAEKGSAGQIRVLQAQKRKMRTVLTSTSSPLTAHQLKLSLSALLKLYLYPCYFAFQTTLEWLASCLHEIEELQRLQQTETKKETETEMVDLVSIVSSICLEVLDIVIIKEWKQYQQVLQENHHTVDCNMILQWLPAFNALALLDREFAWMSVGEGYEALHQYASLLMEMFHISCEQLGCVMTTTTTTTRHTPSSTLSVPQMIKWGSICTECARNIVSVLKSRRASVKFISSSSWLTELLKSLLTYSWQLLATEHVPTKDAYTSAGSVLVLVFAMLMQQQEPDMVESSLSNLIRSICQSENSQPSVDIMHRLTAFASSAATAADPTKALFDFSCTSRCSLLRGLIHSTEMETLLATANERSLYFDDILDTVSYLCLHGNSTNQLYAMQSLEVWITRLFDLLRRNLLPVQTIEQIRTAFIKSRLSLITRVLCTSWAHPVRQVSHIVPAIYETLIKTLMILHPHDTTSMTTTSSSTWSEILLEASRMPSFHRGKYQAMKILMESIGVHFFLSLQPHILDELVTAMKDRDISASVATLIVAIVKSLLSEATKKEKVPSGSDTTASSEHAGQQTSVVSMWNKQVITALSSNEKSWRNNVADYLLPELCKLENDCCVKLLSNLEEKMFTSSGSGDLWCVVQILYNARQLGQSLNFTAEEEKRKTWIEQALATAAISVDDYLRLAALITLTTSLKTTIPLALEDWRLFQQVLPHSLKTSDADQCSKIGRAIKNVILRAKLNANKSAEGLQFLEEVLHWFVQEVVKKQLYPGVTFDREYSVLYVLHTIYTTLANEEGGGNEKKDKKEKEKDGVVGNTKTGHANNSTNLVTLLTNKLDVTLVDNLLNCFLSTWDKSRRISSELMIRLLLHPWPGYGENSAVHKVIQWAKGLAESARLRESDAGAQLLSSVFTVYCIDLGWRLFSTDHVANEKMSSSGDRMEGIVSSCEEFLNFLLKSLETTLQQLEKIFEAITSQQFMMNDFLSSHELEGDFALGHGLLLSLKLCLQSLDKAGMFKPSTHIQRWAAVIKKIEVMARKSMELAMTVVAEAKSDVPFAPAPTSSASSVVNKEVSSETSSTVTCKGPINSATGLTMAASYVNTNSFMSTVNTEDGIGSDNANEENGESQLGAKAQRAIVAAWLLVKESTALLATLVEVTPIPTTALSAGSNNEVLEENVLMLNTKEIENIGNLLLDALGRLKHMGAIAEAHVGLQAVTTVLLRYGDRNSYLSHLPSIWLSSLINRLTNHQQVFILRRSAGFAYSFLSLLRSEPANCTPTLLHEAMKALLAIVAKGIANGTSTEEANNAEESEAEDWKLSVHALNVLRLIILDGAFGADLDQYIPQSLTLAFIGFQSPHWAVRNSAMMVFSATVQRAVSKEKNDCGGSTAVTAQDFFHRYSGTTAANSMPLFHFLIQRLDRITTPYLEGKFSGDLDHSLFPLLLLFAKFRATMFPVTATEVSNSPVETNDDSSKSFDLTQFLPLFSRCAHSKVALVRSMAGRAFSTLIPITETPEMLEKLLSSLVTELEEKSGKVLGTNEIHGRLLQLLEVIQQIVKHKQQSIDSTHAFFVAIEESLLLKEDAETPSSFVLLLHRLMCQLSPLSHDAQPPSEQKKVRTFVTCPSIHLALFQILKALQALSSKAGNQDLAQYLILEESRTIVTFYQSRQIGRKPVGCQRARAISLQIDPYAPWTLREALKELVFHDLFLFASSEKDEVLQSSASQELQVLLHSLSHPVSEVREGAAQGILNFLTSNKATPTLLSTAKSLSFYFQDVLPKVIAALNQETEPVLIEVFLGVLNKILTLTNTEDPASELLPKSTRVSILTLLFRIITNHKISSSSRLEITTIAPVNTMVWKAGSCLAIETFSHLIGPLLIECITSSHDGISSNEQAMVQALCEHWIRFITLACHEDQPVDLRYSGALGLVHSSIFKIYATTRVSTATNSVNRGIWQSWILHFFLLCLDLLQDDDDDVREVANELICQLVSSQSGSKVLGLTTTSYSLQEHLPHAIAALLQDISRTHTALAAESLQKILRKLSFFIGNEDSVKSLLQSTSKQLSHKIFEAEQSNLFIENLKGGESLIAALFGSSIQVSLSSSLLNLNKTIDLAFEVLRGVVSAFGSHTTSTVATIGGVTYDKDMFHFLILSLQMIRQALQVQGLVSAEDQSRLQSLVNEMMGAINQRSISTVIHPLIIDELQSIRSQV